MFKVKFTDIGEGLHEGKVTEVLVNIGDSVKMGQSLFAVETDKVNAEIPSPVDGKVSEILIKKDQDINVGDVVFIIDDGSTTAADSNVSTASKEPEISGGSCVPNLPEPEEENASVVGSTPVSNHVITRQVPQPSDIKKPAAEIRATPQARRMAVKLNIDLSKIIASSPSGRISIEDIEAYNNQASASVQPATAQQPVRSNLSTTGLEVEAISMTGIRKATVKAMKYSHSTNASFTSFKKIDITNIYDLRNNLKDFAKQSDIKLTYLAFVVKAVAKALVDNPNINVRIDEENNAIQYIKNINISVAVDTPYGLVVPVIFNANNLSLFEIAKEISNIASKAKDKKLAVSDMTNGTFTISNIGSVGLEYATPIINSPESAIMGVGIMKKEPVYIGDEVKPRYIMPFSITADHRVIDGADVGRFLQKVEEYLTNPIILLT
ncbi:2-oxo acid dehydrogenase subunit E2 [Mesoplasma syrphidae]|uniref:Dihydrolipoamide acetyltransferase component of pyruvate dehydrogenase complex n=1 Tax=Mesoplasma syrphidae TaxID=225999 RepID=A0A2K9C8B1_9MOLU|nr:dihydrolipoamide acetyltransferase family protein [Mesoplasma syrphidae]AUF83245.1 2-oxo acid dehydrogenase subunit E2 [Mesoplasma syrphidae]